MENTGFFYVTSFVAAIVIGGLVYAFIQLKKKHPERSLGDTLNYIFLHDTTTIAVIGLIAVNTFEGIMAASIPSAPGEVNIQPIARFGSHLFISFIAIAFGLASIGAMVRIKFIKENKPEVAAIALACLAGAILIPFANIFLIAQGLGQIPELVYVLKGRWLEGFSHMTYPMAASIIMWVLHYVLMIADAFLALKLGTHVVLSIFTKGSNISASEIDKKITEKGEKEKEEADKHPDNIIRKILKRYRFKGNNEYLGFVQNSIAKKDALADGPKAKLGNKLVELEKEIHKIDTTKGEDEDARKAANKKIFNLISEFWKKSHTNGEGFGVELPAKGSSGNWTGQRDSALSPTARAKKKRGSTIVM